MKQKSKNSSEEDGSEDYGDMTPIFYTCQIFWLKMGLKWFWRRGWKLAFQFYIVIFSFVSVKRDTSLVMITLEPWTSGQVVFTSEQGDKSSLWAKKSDLFWHKKCSILGLHWCTLTALLCVLLTETGFLKKNVHNAPEFFPQFFIGNLFPSIFFIPQLCLSDHTNVFSKKGQMETKTVCFGFEKKHVHKTNPAFNHSQQRVFSSKTSFLKNYLLKKRRTDLGIMGCKVFVRFLPLGVKPPQGCNLERCIAFFSIFSETKHQLSSTNNTPKKPHERHFTHVHCHLV